jgi:hypothetical protein
MPLVTTTKLSKINRPPRACSAHRGQSQGERASLPIPLGTVKGAVAFFFATGRERFPIQQGLVARGGSRADRASNHFDRSLRQPHFGEPMWLTDRLVYRFSVGRQVGKNESQNSAPSITSDSSSRRAVTPPGSVRQRGGAEDGAGALISSAS